MQIKWQSVDPEKTSLSAVRPGSAQFAKLHLSQ